MSGNTPPNGGPVVPVNPPAGNAADQVDSKNAVEQIYHELVGMFGLGVGSVSPVTIYEERNLLMGADVGNFPNGVCKKIEKIGILRVLRQVLTIDQPARLLERGTYDYIGSDSINAQQLKPETVVDAEFRLSDDMFNISNIMGGPSGVKVSNQYNEVLFGLVPLPAADTDSEKRLHDDQDKICAWLTEKVDNFTPPIDDVLKNLPSDYATFMPSGDATDSSDRYALDEDGVLRPVGASASDSSSANGATTDTTKDEKQIARIDLYQKLLDLYENQRFRWATFKRNARPKDMAIATPADIDNFNRMLATYAPIVDKKLEALWTVLLVRGQYHRVRRFIGYVDVSTASEALQTAKENLRASVVRSIDDTQDVYPVYFDPSNWASHLTTAFAPEDLLSSESVIRQQIFEKEKTRAALLSRRNALVGSDKSVADAEAAERIQSDSLRTAQTTLTGTYSDTSLKVIELFFDAYMASTGSPAAAQALIAALGTTDLDKLNTMLDKVKQPSINSTGFSSLLTAKNDVLKAQAAYEIAAERLAQAQTAAAAARASDTKTALLEMNVRIEALTMDIEYLMQTMKASKNPTSEALTISGQTVPLPSATGTPDMVINLPSQAVGASVWTEIVTRKTKSASTSQTLNSSFASNTSYNVGLFFGGASGSDKQAVARDFATHNVTNTTIQCGFRAMKVTINRPWFDAGLFRLSSDFCHVESTSISTSDADAVRAALGLSTQKNTADLSSNVVNDMNKCMLPSWPSAFIVVKDVHLTYEADGDFSETDVHDVQKSTTDGGGFLCFSAGKSESSSEHRTSAAIAVAGKQMSIKIPAPQIIGWVCELMPKDATKPMGSYKSLDSSEFRAIRLDS